MPKRKKSKKRSEASPNIILVQLTNDTDFNDSMDSIHEKKKVGFKIEDGFEIKEVKQGSIAFVRATNHPVQRDPGG
jgi:hypothetical protein